MRDADYIVIFDGGSLGNPGPGYGSYALMSRTGRKRTRRLDFGTAMTSNEAEYRALIGALDDLLATIQADTGTGCRQPQEFRVEIRGDSQLVINQLCRRWKVKKPHLMALYNQVMERAERFAAVAFVWQRRQESVRALGH